MHVSVRWQAGMLGKYRAASGSNQVSVHSSDNIAGRTSEGHTTGSSGSSDLEGEMAADTEVSVSVSSVEARERAAM